MQVVDDAGNVALSSWQAPTSSPPALILALAPPTITTGVGQTFELPILVQANTLPVDAVSAYLNFDPALLSVATITPGTALPSLLQNQFDNTTGQIDFAAGTFDNFPSAPSP